MKKKLLAIAALAAVCALSFGQQAGPQGGGFGPPQGPGGGMRGGPGMGPGGGLQGPRLLMNPSVQKELKLTEEQKQQLGELMPMRGPGGPGGPGGGGFQGGPPQGGQGGGQRGQGGPPRGEGGGQGGFQGGPPRGEGGPGQRGPGGPGGQGRGPGGGQQDQQMEKKIKEILTDSQYKRYQEIGLQQQGAMAITRPEIGQKLNLSEDQREQIREILQNNRQNMRPPQGGEGERPDPRQMQAQMEKNREALNAKIVAVLSGEQKSTWQSMLGRPFKIEHPQGGPGFGGPGGPGGQGRGPGGGGGQRGGGGGGF